MINRIKKKLGPAGFVVAIVALVVALAGTAIAALPGLNSKQKKQTTAIAKKFAGKNGATGATGSPGPAGPQGPKGDPGVEGKPGVDGQDGEDGFCSLSNPECVLPPGALMTGYFATNSSGGNSAFGPISFPLRLPSAPEVKRVLPGEDGSAEGCPGGSENPDAEPGILCVYFEVKENGFFTSLKPDPTSGIVIELFGGEATAPTIGWGTWAVRAPEVE